MSNTIQVSDLITKFFEDKKVEHVFLLSGGMMMNLLDSVSKSKQIKYICNHHEQACSIAAESYSKIKNSIGVCYATSGPGATNIVTGVAGSWLDSTPVFFITGQSRTALTTRGRGIENLRTYGNFEVDIVEIIKPITKYSHFVDDPNTILFHLEKAYHIALSGRPGPVLLDIPLDIQGATVNIEELQKFDDFENGNAGIDLSEIICQLNSSKKPLFLAGHGIRVANQVEQFRLLMRNLQIPVVTTQLANDVIEYNNDLYIGKVGLRGDRPGNFAIQNADLIIVLGSSLHVTTTGYELNHFAPNAMKIIIDIDSAILEKNKSITNLQFQCDVASFINNFSRIIEPLKVDDWLEQTRSWKSLYKVSQEPHNFTQYSINTYQFIDTLSYVLKDDEIIITDAGSLYYIVGQAFKCKPKQRLIVSGALGAMGYALPASIGAAFANKEKNVICLTGDGSVHLNIQELQTIAHHKLNCKIVIINNNGYASIRNSQSAFLKGHTAGSSLETGVSLPPWKKIADAYSIPFFTEDKPDTLLSFLNSVLFIDGPVIIEIVVPDDVVMIPVVNSVRLLDGSFKSNQLHEMSPELPIVKHNAKL
jgi:acetolactate synthase I/II/III large subunit